MSLYVNGEVRVCMLMEKCEFREVKCLEIKGLEKLRERISGSRARSVTQF